MVHQLQEALANQLDVLGSLAVGLEAVEESVCNYMNHMQKYIKYAKSKQYMQNMQEHSQYAEHDLHTDFAVEELIDTLKSPGVELLVNCVEHRANNFVPHVVKPPAIDWLAGPNEIPAQAEAFTHSGRASQIWRATNPHLDCPLPASRSQRFFSFGTRWKGAVSATHVQNSIVQIHVVG